MRFLPKWDNTLLAHADRRRVLPEELRKTVIGKNGDVTQTFLVDGVVAGSWTRGQEGQGRRSRRSPLSPALRGARSMTRPRVLEAWLALMHIGAHLSSSGGIHTAVDRAEAVGAESLQVFTQSPRAWRPTNHDPANFDRFRERRAEVGLHGVLCHALYLCNFAATER